jgi:hypothetical protein
MKFIESIRNEGVLPPWHGFLVNILSYFIFVFFLYLIGMGTGWTVIAFALTLSGIAFSIVNAIYGMMHNLFTIPRLGQGLLFFHLCVFALCVVLWNFNLVWWALGVQFFTNMADGKEKKRTI